MTYFQLDAIFPELKCARQELRNNLRATSSALGTATPFADQEQATVLGVLLIRFHLCLNENQSLPRNSEMEEWHDLGVFVKDAIPVRTFLSHRGELVHVPEALVELYLSGKPVDAGITQDQAQPANLVIAHGKTSTTLRKTLLLKLRKRAIASPSSNSKPSSTSASHLESHPTA